MRNFFRTHEGFAALWLLAAIETASAQTPVAMVPGLNFSGSGFGADSAYLVPDANGAPGRSYYVEFVNGHFAVYSKTNGLRVASKTHYQFWEEAGLAYTGSESVDPRTLYDAGAERWFVSSVEVNPINLSSNRLLLAVSAGEDPTGSWHGFRLPGAEGRFADFATLGFDQEAVYVAAYIVSGSDGTRGTNLLIRIPKEDLLASAPGITRLTLFPSLPGGSYGNILQPAAKLNGTGRGTILAMTSLAWDRLEHTGLSASRLRMGGDGGTWEVVPVFIPTPPYSNPGRTLQPDGSDLLAIGDTRLSATVYEVNDTLYAVHSTRDETRVVLRWYRVRSEDFRLLEYGTISDPELDLFYPSIAANDAGVVVIGYNGCSANSFISSYAVAGHTRNETTSFGPPVLLKAGHDSYTNISPTSGNYRWGDYSATCLDPEDSFRFWTIQSYPYSSDAWSTRITELRTALPYLEISQAAESVFLSWFGSAGVLELETATALDSSTWEPLSVEANEQDGRQVVTLPATDYQRFFRLRNGMTRRP